MENTTIDTLVKSVADLQDAFAGLSVSAPVVEVKDTKEELQAKFFDAVKSVDFKNVSTLIEDGSVKAESFNTVDAASAGAGVVEVLSRKILTRALEHREMTKLFSHATAPSVDHSHQVQVGVGSARWESENTGLINGVNTGSPTFAKIKMTSGKAVTLPVITQEALSDPYFDAQSYLVNDSQKQLSRLVSEGLINGAGEGQPRGFLTYFDAVEGLKGVETRKVDNFPVFSGSIADADLLTTLSDMTQELVSSYRVGAKFVVSAALAHTIRNIKDADGRPMMAPAIHASHFGTLFGFPIVVDNLMTEDKPAVFGRLEDAFTVFHIPTKMNFQANPFRYHGAVEFYISQRIGTMVMDNEAVVALIPVVARKAK